MNIFFNSVLIILVATKENLDLATLLKIVQLFKESEDITFLGDEHDLDEFLFVANQIIDFGESAHICLKSVKRRRLGAIFLMKIQLLLSLMYVTVFFTTMMR